MIEYEFLEEYKRLDQVCRDMLGTEKGVSDYLAAMEACGEPIEVPSWREDRNALKHLRWVRNRIAHETTDGDCTADDLTDLKRMYRRFLSGKDPLSLLRKERPTKAAPNAPSSAVVIRVPARRGNRRQHATATALTLLIYLGAIAAFVFLVILAVRGGN